MSITDNRTENFSFPLPDRDNLLWDDVVRLSEALTKIDEEIKHINDVAQRTNDQKVSRGGDIMRNLVVGVPVNASTEQNLCEKNGSSIVFISERDIEGEGLSLHTGVRLRARMLGGWGSGQLVVDVGTNWADRQDDPDEALPFAENCKGAVIVGMETLLVKRHDGLYLDVFAAADKPSRTDYEYDSNGLLIKCSEIIVHSWRVTEYTYDNGKVATVTTKYKGQTRKETYHYDGAGRLSGVIAEEY